LNEHEDLTKPALAVHDDAGVLWVTFARPEASNALTPADLEYMGRVIRDAGNDPRAVVFTGSGDRSFSAGMHLGSLSILDVASAREMIARNRELLATIRQAPFPTIAAINGHCIGAGLGIALVADIRIATTNATFALPEIRVGVPSVCDIALLQQHIGLSKAKEMILSGDKYSVAEMDRYGLLNAVVEPEQLVPATERMLARITGHTKTVLSAQKRLFEAWQNSSLTAAIDLSVEIFASVFASPETLEQMERHRSDVALKAHA